MHTENATERTQTLALPVAARSLIDPYCTRLFC